jgi:hypothetical protein
MDTSKIMDLSLQEAKMDRIPEDSEVYVEGRDLGRAVFGVDLDAAELMLAKQQGFDVAIAHHPCGGGTWAGFPKVLERHIPIMKGAGVPREQAEAAVREMQDEHGPRTHLLNYDRLPSVARMLGLPFMNIHAPADEIGRREMAKGIKEGVGADAKVADAIAVLRKLPEFAHARTAIIVRMGSESAPLGRWVFSHGAGTNGGYPVASAMFRNGVDTLFYIHVDPGHLKRIKEEFAKSKKNLVITGHIASDSVGINVVIRRLRREGLEVHAMGGVIE